MSRHYELNAGEMAAEPLPNRALPRGMKVDVYLVNEDDSRGDDDARPLRIEYGFRAERDRKLPNNVESEA